MNKIEKLELKHLCGYLPYGLEVFNENSSSKGVILRNLSFDTPQWVLDELKPLLLPLSALTEQLQDGSVPIVELAKMAWTNNEPLIKKYYISNYILKYTFDGDEYYFSFDKSYGFSFCRMTPHQTFMPINNQLQLFEYLYSKHFDIYGLIPAGLAIDKRTVKL